MENTRLIAAASDVGKIRANNQDSGYAGKYLFFVADGMGGHAGGDVASAITTHRVADADRAFASVQDAAVALQSALLSANAQLADSVREHPELAGMGTTASALVRTGDEVVTAHIGDSRIYLYRDGDLSQVTTDHTFVQRLVDAGRITEEEAMTHPRRSVLMRVLGDVATAPEIDIQVFGTQPGDRWLLCSDGLSGFVSHDEILSTMLRRDSAEVTAKRLIRQSLDHGAPDNVTVVVFDVDDQPVNEADEGEAILVGSAADPLTFGTGAPASRNRRRQLLRRSQVRKAHFEPASQDFLDELIEEDERRAQRRKILWIVGIGLLVIVVVAGLLLAWQWTQTRYYVGSNGQNVVIFNGVHHRLGPISLSRVHEHTDVSVHQLRFDDRQQIESTISVDSLTDARRVVSELGGPRVDE